MSTNDAWVGRTLDRRYRLEHVIGAGAMGVVYRAEHTGLGRPVAVKVLHDLRNRHPEVVERTAREAKVLSAISHDNVVTVTDFGEADGVLYLTMELLHGETLADMLCAGDRWPEPERAIWIGGEILRGLAALHESGILHRDLKPANVFMQRTPSGSIRVKLLDFGLAKVLEGSDVAAADLDTTQQGRIIGTPSYMAPEQASAREVDARADLYAVGVLLYLMLTGRCPFMADDRWKVIQMIITDPVPPLTEANTDILPTKELQAFFDRALAKDPEGRFDDVPEMLAALESLPAPPLRFRSEVAALRERVRAVESSGGWKSAPPASTPPAEGTLPLSASMVLSARDSRQPPPTPRNEPTLPVSASMLLSSQRATGLRVPKLSQQALHAQERFSMAPLVASRVVDDEGRGMFSLFGTCLMGVLLTLVLGLVWLDENKIPVELTPEPQVTASAPLEEKAPPSLAVAEALIPYQEKLRAGERLDSLDVSRIREVHRKDRKDPVPHLLLAHDFVERGWSRAAKGRYTRALSLHPDARHFEWTLPDLVRLATAPKTAHWASDLLAELYGPSALSHIDAVLAGVEDGAANADLRSLRSRLRVMQPNSAETHHVSTHRVH